MFPILLSGLFLQNWVDLCHPKLDCGGIAWQTPMRVRLMYSANHAPMNPDELNGEVVRLGRQFH